MKLRIWLFVALTLPAWLPVNPAGAGTMQTEFDLGKGGTEVFSIFMPENSGTYRWSASGTGKMSIGIKRCGQAAGRGQTDSHYAAWYDLAKAEVQSSKAPSADLDCSYGVHLTCETGGCRGRFTFSVENVALDTLLTGENAAGGDKPATPLPPPPPPASNLPRVVEGGDAGGQNASAAPVPYNCAIRGVMARGDYDFYAFDYPGGIFRAYSEPGLDLVADLIRASDGQVLVRAGTDSRQFLIEGDLSAGRYILAIRVMHHAGEGPYRLGLGMPSGCAVQETR